MSGKCAKLQDMAGSLDFPAAVYGRWMKLKSPDFRGRNKKHPR